MKDQWMKLQNGSDVRGVALEGVEGEAVNFSPETAAKIAVAFAEWLSDKIDKPCEELRISIGRDSRLSGPAIAAEVSKYLLDIGVDVVDTGLASTPAMFMSTIIEGYQYDGAMMLTASHLPFNRNGMKFFTPDGGLEKADITSILERAASGSKADAAPVVRGTYSEVDFISVYAEHLCNVIRKGANDPDDYDQPLKGMRIVLDAGNGAGGFFDEKVLQPLGADTTGSQFLDPDGSFPNHIPNPENAEAMASIRKAVLENKADLGIIFDTDVDRAGAVDKNGNEINRNPIIALMAAIVLQDHPGTTIVTDSITSDELKVFIEDKLGGRHHRFKRGYRNVINESIRLNEEGEESWLAIETSGHGALKENYFLDDGAYLVAKILIQAARLKREGKSIDLLLADLDEPAESKEFRLPILSSDFAKTGQAVIDELTSIAGKLEGWNIAPKNYEGIRVSLDKANGNGWFLLRLSLHDPLMPLNIESKDEGGVRVIAEAVCKQLEKMDGLDLSPLTSFLAS